MKPAATTSPGQQPDVTAAESHGGTYQSVLDRRKQPIRGLCCRNGRFYARLSIEDPATGRKAIRRVPLAAETVAQATVELRTLQTRRQDQALPALRRAPKFNEYVDQYLAYFETVKGAKRKRTIETETGHLNQWKAHLGETRLNQISRAMINDFITKRKAPKIGKDKMEKTISNRTINLAIVCLRNVLKKALEEGWIKALPTENMRPLKYTARKRQLFTLADMEKICGQALETSKNGREFADYLRLMAYCGSRMTETLALKWADVDWQQKQLTIGADGQSKNHQARVVDFNPKLEAHLREMKQRKAPDTVWLFPSPQRGKQDRASKTFRETLLMARKAAGLEGFGFHDCRHFFISMCVMSGIDFLTIARWVGHQDGGILIGKVYGHLSNEHAQRQAQRINFGPTVLAAEAS